MSKRPGSVEGSISFLTVSCAAWKLPKSLPPAKVVVAVAIGPQGQGECPAGALGVPPAVDAFGYEHVTRSIAASLRAYLVGSVSRGMRVPARARLWVSACVPWRL